VGSTTVFSHLVSFLRHKRVNIKEVYAELEEYIDSHTPLIPEDSELDIVPTVGFQRVAISKCSTVTNSKRLLRACDIM
jgi:hypothetical protein